LSNNKFHHQFVVSFLLLFLDLILNFCCFSGFFFLSFSCNCGFKDRRQLIVFLYALEEYFGWVGNDYYFCFWLPMKCGQCGEVCNHNKKMCDIVIWFKIFKCLDYVYNCFEVDKPIGDRKLSEKFVSICLTIIFYWVTINLNFEWSFYRNWVLMFWLLVEIDSWLLLFHFWEYISFYCLLLLDNNKFIAPQ
jgi:hypothetical protein